MRKRSITIDGHRTSISLEDAFWGELSALARARGTSLNALVSEIDRGRSAPRAEPRATPAGGPGNLSSALRLYVLAELKKRLISQA